jgi:stalled ribosome rescue protein Dom34
MSEYFDAIVWIDREEAKVFHCSAAGDVKLVLKHTSAKRRHHTANHEDSTKHAVDEEFLERIVAAFDHPGGILITGPGNSKVELRHYMDQHCPDLAARFYGVETVNDPGDEGILAVARQFFKGRSHRHMSEVGPGARK